MSKWLFLCAACFFIAGLFVFIFERIPGAGRLPGDLLFKKPAFTVYIPLTTCLVLSILLTLILNFFGKK